MRSGLIGGIRRLVRKVAPAGDTRRNTGETRRGESDTELLFEYTPCLDGDPDPGEVVWTWVPYEEDPTQGKDRPVVIIGRRQASLMGVPLTSKSHANEVQVAIGAGPWDQAGRRSYAKVERLLRIDPAQVRREGAVLERQHFDEVVAGVRRTHRGP